MADYSALKATIDASINTNGQQAITGAILNDVLNEMVDVLGEGYQFMGVATPLTNPDTPDGKVFYIAGEVGNYTNFGQVITIPGIYIFTYDSVWVTNIVLQLNASLELALVTDDGINFVDTYMNIGVKIDTNGIDAINMLTIEPI